MTPARAVVEAWWDALMEETMAANLPKLIALIDAALAERERATWKAASEFVRASFLVGPGQRTYAWSDKQTEHIAAALAVRGEA